MLMPETSISETTIVPNHIAIIPDGNRRWARSRGLEPWEGHESGAKNSELLIREARRLGVRELSFWGSSVENLTKRPLRERQELLRIYSEYFEKLLRDEEVFADRVRIRFIGRWEEQFPESLKKLLREISEKTASHERYFLNFFLAYSGDDAMVEAFREMSRRGLMPDEVSPDVIKDCLMTREVSVVDLLVRTGGEPHLSAGFLMWEIANSQLFFSEKLYPDFGEVELRAAIADYANRERRLGK
jgi:undecaprenyl diphosphate synthase